MSDEELSRLPVFAGAMSTRGRNYVEFKVRPDQLIEACVSVSSIPGLYHLSTITGVDLGQQIALMYHFWRGREFVVVATEVPKTDPRLPSLSGMLPAATLYEAEVKDLLGVKFEGNPFAERRLLLPDSYPAEAPPPLLKEADPEKIRKMMGLE